MPVRPVARCAASSSTASPSIPPVPVEAINYGLAEAAPIIVHLAGDESRSGRLRRYCTSIVEVTGLDDGRVSTTELWGLDGARQPRAPPRAVVAAPRATGPGGVGLERQRLGAGAVVERGAALTWRCSSACSVRSPASACCTASRRGRRRRRPGRRRRPTGAASFVRSSRRSSAALLGLVADRLGRRRPRRGVRRARRGSGCQRSRRTSAKVEQARIKALASWCEQLRDLLTAEHGIVGTIAATARTCPEPIRPEVERLATRLSRQSPDSAIRQFAAELDDPSGDLVASVLLLAMSRSSRTSELLAELAGTIRERAAMRLRVEADRAGQRSEARFIIAFSAVAIAGVLIFGRDSEFLDAYDDASGQLVFGSSSPVSPSVVGG